MLILFLSSACSDNDDSVPEQPSSADAERSTIVPSIRHCFRNEYPIDDTKDVEELIIIVDNDQVTGEYNWIPAYKDRRLGRFDGSLQENTISASYEFEQEGQSTTTAISISIEGKQAIVKGGQPELGLNQTLARVAC